MDLPSVSPAAMRVVRLLVGREPQTINELIEAAGVTRTAIIEQLNELVAAGYVERTTERLHGRGRPRYRYAATKRCLEMLFVGNQHLVVPAIFQALQEIGGSDLKCKVANRVAEILADHYRHQMTASEPEERLLEIGRVLQREGVLVEVQRENGQVIFRKRSCPFISMFESSRTVCCIDQKMLELVVGKPVKQLESRHDGAPCCTFTLQNSNGHIS